MEERRVWDETQLRKYDIPLEYVPKYRYDHPKVRELIAENKPVIITGSDLISSALKWDVDYLKEHMNNSDCTVIFSKNHKFKYFDDKSMRPDIKTIFVPPTRKVSMKMTEFAKRLREWKKGDERLYLQQMLNSTVGPEIMRDFLGFRWDWINALQESMSWGPLTSNLLLIAMEGNVTPCHYDEQQNFFAQIRGFKRFIMFPPEQFECLYPHPVYHPHDRQSQVDFERPDCAKFPKFKDVRGQEAVIGPGDVLYIPIYWWHHVESLMRGGYTVSVNFWYKEKDIDQPTENSAEALEELVEEQEPSQSSHSKHEASVPNNKTPARPYKQSTEKLDCVLDSIEDYFKMLKRTEDRHDIFGKNVAVKMRDISNNSNTQRLLADKIINDVLFMADMGQLTLSHSVRGPIDNTPTEFPPSQYVTNNDTYYQDGTYGYQGLHPISFSEVTTNRNNSNQSLSSHVNMSSCVPPPRGGRQATTRPYSYKNRSDIVKIKDI